MSINASPETVNLLGILDRQLHAVQELSAELIACRTAFVAMDVDGIYRHTAIQSALCDSLHTLEEQRRVAWRAACCGAGVDPATGNVSSLVALLDPRLGMAIRDIVTKLVLADGELRRLNRANTILINGSRRTLTILGNVLASFAPTYASPLTARNQGAQASSVTLP